MTLDNLRPELRWALEAAHDKKAQHVTVLDLRELSAFSQWFLVCSGSSTPQLEAISDAIEERLREHNVRPAHREGRPGAEWVLLDYGAFIVHIFSERARLYYDLERLWRAAPKFDFPTPGETANGANRSAANIEPPDAPSPEAHR